MADAVAGDEIVIVALFTRAWIEINSEKATVTSTGVALFTRAWIEMWSSVLSTSIQTVALFTRAWIEMADAVAGDEIVISRPLHEGVD